MLIATQKRTALDLYDYLLRVKVGPEERAWLVSGREPEEFDIFFAKRKCANAFMGDVIWRSGKLVRARLTRPQFYAVLEDPCVIRIRKTGTELGFIPPQLMRFLPFIALGFGALLIVLLLTGRRKRKEEKREEPRFPQIVVVR